MEANVQIAECPAMLARKVAGPPVGSSHGLVHTSFGPSVVDPPTDNWWLPTGREVREGAGVDGCWGGGCLGEGESRS